MPVTKSVEIIRQTLTPGAHSDFTIKIFPGADHSPHLRSAADSMRVAPGYEETMQAWVLKRLSQMGFDRFVKLALRTQAPLVCTYPGSNWRAGHSMLAHFDRA